MNDAMIHTTSQLPPSTLTEHVYGQLKRAILHGQITPGDRVVAQQVADHFGTSLTPVRESLQKLAKDGLIHFRPHRGAVAVVPKPEELGIPFTLVVDVATLVS